MIGREVEVRAAGAGRAGELTRGSGAGVEKCGFCRGKGRALGSKGDLGGTAPTCGVYLGAGHGD